MIKLSTIALFTSALALRVLSSPTSHGETAPNVIHKRNPQRASTVTVTKTIASTSVSTLTTCNTGSASSKPTTTKSSTSPAQPTVTKSSTGTFSPSATGEPYQEGNKCWVVPQAGRFNHKKEFTFFQGIPNGLSASNYIVYDTYRGAPYNHQFEPKNLVVPGVRNPKQGMTVSSAEVVTTDDDIFYASVRTTAIMSTVPGTCHG